MTGWSLSDTYTYNNITLPQQNSSDVLNLSLFIRFHTTQKLHVQSQLYVTQDLQLLCP